MDGAEHAPGPAVATGAAASKETRASHGFRPGRADTPPPYWEPSPCRSSLRGSVHEYGYTPGALGMAVGEGPAGEVPRVRDRVRGEGHVVGDPGGIPAPVSRSPPGPTRMGRRAPKKVVRDRHRRGGHHRPQPPAPPGRRCLPSSWGRCPLSPPHPDRGPQQKARGGPPPPPRGGGGKEGFFFSPLGPRTWVPIHSAPPGKGSRGASSLTRNRSRRAPHTILKLDRLKQSKNFECTGEVRLIALRWPQGGRGAW